VGAPSSRLGRSRVAPLRSSWASMSWVTQFADAMESDSVALRARSARGREFASCRRGATKGSGLASPTVEMMLRRVSDRARVEGMRALRQALDGIRGLGGRMPGGDIYVVRASLSNRPDADKSIWSRDAETERGEVTSPDAAQNTTVDESTPVHLTERDVELTQGLDRIADTIERLAVQLDSYHHKLAEHLDAIEFLLREIVIGAVPVSAARSVVLGGVIDPEAIDLTSPEITTIADGYPLEVDTPVEVWSRFHDRWICGFAIADAVEGPGGCRYRLTRRSDGIPLPIPFDASDVRATTSTFDPQHPTD
jgi:hypothetical protein